MSHDLDEKFYAASYPDILVDETNARNHYEAFGENQGRFPNLHSLRIAAVDPVQFDAILPHVDPEFYGSQVPNLAETGMSAAEHYYHIGWKLSLDPSPRFSTDGYLIDNEDVAKSKINPLYHWIAFGRAEMRSGDRNFSNFGGQNRCSLYDMVAADFDLDFYVSNYDVAKDFDPVRHFITVGWRLGHNPNADFDVQFYLSRSPDVVQLSVNPFHHYLTLGRFEGRMPNEAALRRGLDLTLEELAIAPFFDSDFYLEQHPEIATIHANPLRHYANTGWRRGWDPSREFSTSFYLAISKDVEESGQNPFVHYILDGADAGRPPRPTNEVYLAAEGNYLNSEAVAKLIEPLFDNDYYCERYPDIPSNNLDALQHYISSGWLEGRDPAAWFSTSFYLQNYPGVKSVGMNPLFHYVVWGKANKYNTFDAGLLGKRIKKINNSKIIRGHDFDSVRQSLVAASPLAGGHANPSCLNIGWVIPDYDAGGGGHMTIFRTIKWLEIFGHKCTILVNNPVHDRTNQERLQIILKHYQIIQANVRVFDINNIDQFDCLIATSWDSAYLVDKVPNAKSKFYFVQDYEPYFYATGSRSLLAEQTYRLDLDCLCASRWLQNRMLALGRRATSFDLAADASYWPAPERLVDNGPLRIAFYARGHTSRRAVELGFLALEKLAQHDLDFVVDIFGTHDEIPHAPFEAVHHGIATADELRAIYQAADIGLCFSATNYSLVPQEMMATGLPVVELDTESTREAFPTGVVHLAEPTPDGISDVLASLLNDRDARIAQGKRGLEWVGSLSWEKSARSIEQALISRLQALDAIDGSAQSSKSEEIVASVVIPTYNGGALFKDILLRVLEQTAPWKFEIIVIDSCSTDGTWEFAESTPGVRAIQIPKKSFQHGRTRNEAAQLAKGEYVAFLTQDAMPVDNFWLYDLVTSLDRHPTAACAYGRHIAYESATPFTKRDLTRHFKAMESLPLLMSKYVDIDRWWSGDTGYRRLLHFYSDNNSCLRRSVWERYPYPEIDYGEDQVWAEQIISLGYGKLYVRSAAVFHSHDYSEQETFERARTEAEFFRTQFGYRDIGPSNIVAEAQLKNIDDLTWGTREGLSADEIAAKLRLNVYALSGLAAGSVQRVNIGSAF